LKEKEKKNMFLKNFPKVKYIKKTKEALQNED
jgi:hypothetical protein